MLSLLSLHLSTYILSLSPLIGIYLLFHLAALGYMVYILYWRCRKLSDPSYFYFDTFCSIENRNKQINKFSSILEENVKRTLTTLSRPYGMQQSFDFDYLENLSSAFIVQQKNKFSLMISDESNFYLETNINTYIEKFSHMICRSLNRHANRENIHVRFYYDIIRNEGTFTAIIVNGHKTINKDVFIYDIRNDKMRMTHYLIRYDERLHTYLSTNIAEVKTIDTALIDGTMRTYSKISFDESDEIDEYYNPDVVIVKTLINDFFIV